MKQLKVTRFVTIFCVLSIVSLMRWWFTYDQNLTGIDDANIFFVYAKNLVQGNGLVYNVGGEQVEGFTSFLWVLILGLLYLTGHMEVLALLLNLTLVSYTLYRLTLFADRLNASASSSKVAGEKVMGFGSWIILAFVCLIPGYIDWTILTLMETGLWSSLLILSSLNLCQLFLDPENKKLARSLLYLIPLLVLTRPESMAWGLIFITIRIGQLIYYRETTSKITFKVLPLFTSYFVPLMLLLIFRLSYFGYLLPNTYYAKISGTRKQNIIDGAYYLLRYVKENPFIPIFVLTLGISLILIIRKAYREKGDIKAVNLVQASIILIVGLQFLIPFYTGGDHFYLSRFLQPLYPLLLLGVFNKKFWADHSSLKGIKLKKSQAAFAFLSTCLLILATTRFSLLGESPIYKEFEIAQMGRETGTRLNQLFHNSPSYPSVGTYLAGGIAYTYQGTTMDMLGLNNTRMAHAPKNNTNGYKNHSSFNKQVFYQMAPDILHIDFLANLQEASLNEHDSTDFQNQLYNFIFLDKEFQSNYEAVLVATPDGKSWYQAYVNKKYLPQLKNESQKVYILNRKQNIQQLRDSLLLQLGLNK